MKSSCFRPGGTCEFPDGAPCKAAGRCPYAPASDESPTSGLPPGARRTSEVMRAAANLLEMFVPGNFVGDDAHRWARELRERAAKHEHVAHLWTSAPTAIGASEVVQVLREIGEVRRS